MIEWIKYKCAVWRLSRQKRGARRHYKRLHHQAEKDEKSAEELFRLRHQEASDCGAIGDELARVMSRRLVMQAERLGVPVPRDEACWDETYLTGARHLNVKGYAELRIEIRKERDERWKFWQLRVSVLVGLLAGLTGAIG